MIELKIPGGEELKIKHLVLDFNGTLAVDGKLLPDVGPRLIKLAGQVQIHIITSDTFGTVSQQLDDIPCKIIILDTFDPQRKKEEYVSSLNPAGVAAIGNGRNDTGMLRSAALAIAVVQQEGASLQAMQAADIVCPGICPALDLLLNPLRLIATMRH